MEVGVSLSQGVSQIAVVAVIPVETVCFLVFNAIFCASFDGVFLPVRQQSLVVVHSGRSIANDAEFRIPRSDHLHDVAGLETDFFGLAAREMPFAHFVQQALVVGVAGCGVGAYRLYVAPTGRIQFPLNDAESQYYIVPSKLFFLTAFFVLSNFFDGIGSFIGTSCYIIKY